MNIELVPLLKEALDILACDSSIIGNIDHHSTIELGLEGFPNLLITQLDDDVVLWSKLVDYHQQKLLAGAEQLIEPLTRIYEWTKYGQIQLIENDHLFELRAPLHERVLQDSQEFAVALVDFFRLLQLFYQTLQ
ncbi:MAG: hypothetical protein QRY16_14505 [Enterobacterales bacterium endosymbiont of Blomia tropicalis]|uniref:InvB/SpaK family type III secretion system chaperone n=1 Tax=Mixta mediterraneensis TaxID=2758443 RepID=UPI001876BAA9|nr:hypothetical protein [Mixta mediterraneensis]MBE5251918.1 hypothetical protein [Mixta mediterraneensis]MDL4914951.1 hypothetical protein [Mixta mediterraneensis]